MEFIWLILTFSPLCKPVLLKCWGLCSIVALFNTGLGIIKWVWNRTPMKGRHIHSSKCCCLAHACLNSHVWEDMRSLRSIMVWRKRKNKIYLKKKYQCFSRKALRIFHRVIRQQSYKNKVSFKKSWWINRDFFNTIVSTWILSQKSCYCWKLEPMRIHFPGFIFFPESSLTANQLLG